MWMVFLFLIGSVHPVRILMVTYTASLLQTLSPPKPKALALDICPSVLEPIRKQLREVCDCRAGSHVLEVTLGQEKLEKGIVSFPSAPQWQYVSWAEPTIRGPAWWEHWSFGSGCTLGWEECSIVCFAKFGKPTVVILSFQMLSLVWEFY